uniref:Uncharacterized LOC111645961 n=1 Tax=Seriola lalandi dorsalis TaxID=1841481 RepID=A0A3B4WDW6_SERLL
GFVEADVQSECRDRYLWIQVASVQTPRFEAVDGNGVHSISEQLASRCGYTISTFKMDGFTTFRASYYSCFTHNQTDCSCSEVFTFRFNVIVSGGGGWISRPVSAVCSGLIWTHREIICEEDYMEVNVNREFSCGGQRGEGGQVWQAVLSQAQKTAGTAWQLMFLQSDGQVSSMSISEAQTQGYSLTTTTQRMVLRSQYKQLHAKVIMVDGVPVEVVQVSLLFKRKRMVAMIDMSMACSFDGAWLLWDVPWIMNPLVEEAVRFESQNLSVGVEGVLLDEPTATTRGFSLVQQGRLVQIRVPLGAEGGYRKSFVVNNMYKELYVIFLLYEHVFSLLHEDSSSINTRHRMLRVLDTPDDQVFSIYLGNIPADVILEEVWINRKQLMMAESVERAISISPVVHVNGSRAYELRLPFEDAAVHWMVRTPQNEDHLLALQYSIDINFTLTIMPQGDSYYHHTLITAQVFNACTYIVSWSLLLRNKFHPSVRLQHRGYRLHHDTHKTNLEVPVFSIGYTYEGINLSDFYGTFKLLLRDSKTLEVQTSTSKRCLFKTEDMIVCSADGTMTVVMTPTATWPTVRPERTSLLDRTCGPKQADRSRVLFEFKVDSCGTRAMVGESYMVYENEILHDRQLIADGPNLITRESQFKLTVRCFYPLSGVNRLTVDRTFRSETPGYGSHSGQILYQSTLGQNGIVKLNQDVQNLKVDLSLDIQELNQQHETKQPLNSQGSFGGAMVNMEERPVYQPQSQYDPSQASQLRPVLQPPAQYSPDHISTISGKLHLPSRDKKDVPTDTKHKNTVTDSSEETLESVSNEAASTATSWVDQKLKRTGSIERRNIETVQSGVQNIRVKPLSKLVSSGHQTNQKPVVKQENSQISNPSQYGTGMTAVSSDGNHWTSLQLQDHKSSNTRQEQTGFQKLKQGQGVHSVRVKLHQSAVIQLTDLSPNQQGHQQKLVQSMAEMGNSGGQESLGNISQPTGRDKSHQILIRSFIYSFIYFSPV